MIYTLMMYHQNQLQAHKRGSEALGAGGSNISSQMPFHLNEAQCTALESLYNTLTTKAGVHTCKQALYSVFFSLYLEDQPLSQALQTFTSPVAAYFALRCWNNLSGMFINIQDIPVALAKLQYSIRLRCFHKILLSLPAKELEIGNEWVE